MRRLDVMTKTRRTLKCRSVQQHSTAQGRSSTGVACFQYNFVSLESNLDTRMQHLVLLYTINRGKMRVWRSDYWTWKKREVYAQRTCVDREEFKELFQSVKIRV